MKIRNATSYFVFGYGIALATASIVRDDWPWWSAFVAGVILGIGAQLLAKDGK